jgi:hypothetical protein
MCHPHWIHPQATNTKKAATIQPIMAWFTPSTTKKQEEAINADTIAALVIIKKWDKVIPSHSSPQVLTIPMHTNSSQQWSLPVVTSVHLQAGLHQVHLWSHGQRGSNHVQDF